MSAVNFLLSSFSLHQGLFSDSNGQSLSELLPPELPVSLTGFTGLEMEILEDVSVEVSGGVWPWSPPLSLNVESELPEVWKVSQTPRNHEKIQQRELVRNPNKDGGTVQHSAGRCYWNPEEVLKRP